MNNKKRIFILGGSGFVGSSILKALANDSSSPEIFAIENNSSAGEYSNVKKIKGTMFDVPDLIEKIKPHIIIHAARISGKNYPILGGHKAAFLGKKSNLKICKKVIEHNTKLVYISGSLMYGSHPGKQVTEDFPLNPISYAIEYQHAERPFLKEYKNAHIMICRPGWIFGPDSWFKGYFEDIIRQENYVPQYGDGNSFMSIIHRNDLGRLVKEYAFNAPYSDIYNLFSPIGVTQRQFVNELAGFYKKNIKVISKKELIRNYGRVTCDALTCDIPLSTNFKTIMNQFNFNYKTVTDLIKK